MVREVVAFYLRNSGVFKYILHLDRASKPVFQALADENVVYRVLEHLSRRLTNCRSKVLGQELKISSRSKASNEIRPAEKLLVEVSLNDDVVSCP